MYAQIDQSIQAKILLVDDTPSNLQILSKMLTENGIKVRAVTDGQLAINSAQASPPDLILLDINMPEMNGYETCRRLKNDPSTAGIPVIFISALGEPEDKVNGFQVGGIDYITKPFQVDEVLARVKTHLTLHSLQLELMEANRKLAADVNRLKEMETAEHEQRVLAETFRKIASNISSNLDLEKVLDMILFGLSQLIEHDVINISMLSEDGYAYIVRQFGYEKIIQGNENLSPKICINDNPALSHMVETGQPYMISDTSSRPDWVAVIGKEWLKSYLGAPICVRGKVVGFINLESSQKDFYKIEQVEHLLDFTAQAGLAIENARLYSEAQRRVKELSILNEIGQLVSSTTNLAQVTELVYQQINRLLDAYFFVIAVYNPEKEEWGSLYIRRAGIRLENFKHTTEEGFGGYVIKNRKPIFLPDSKTVEDFIQQTGRTSLLSKPLSIMMVPLIFSNHVIGVIGVQHDLVENAFSQDDFTLFNSIATQVAIWIENARLFTEMENLAITDTLTGINNRRQLFILAEQELERALRYNHNLSFIMMDIDHFKQVNDEYGHPAGDKVLCALTHLCMQHLRMVDTIGRYGGEEFLILMPETNHADAIDAAVRLRQQIEKLKVKFEGHTINITASMGVASLESGRKNKQKTTLDKFIKQADEALYLAKASGRNQVR